MIARAIVQTCLGLARLLGWAHRKTPNLPYAAPPAGVPQALPPVDEGPQAFYNTDLRRHIELVRFIKDCAIPPDAAILDVGCATGYLLARLRKHGYSNLSGCDQFPQVLEGCPYRQVDLDREGLQAYADGQFEVVVSSDVLEHLENPAVILREFRRVVRPGGHVFITLPSCWNLYERLRFLRTGNSSRYRSERRSPKNGHISMLPSQILESLTDRAALDLVEMRGSFALFADHVWFRWKHPLLSYVVMYHYRPHATP